jgi:hypothetical protein
MTREPKWRRIMMVLAARGVASSGQLCIATGIPMTTVGPYLHLARSMGAVEKRGVYYAALFTMSDVDDAGRFYDLKRTPTPPQDAATTRGEG